MIRVSPSSPSSQRFEFRRDPRNAAKRCSQEIMRQLIRPLSYRGTFPFRITCFFASPVSSRAKARISARLNMADRAQGSKPVSRRTMSQATSVKREHDPQKREPFCDKIMHQNKGLRGCRSLDPNASGALERECRRDGTPVMSFTPRAACGHPRRSPGARRSPPPASELRTRRA
jgi:hypothetical protein